MNFYSNITKFKNSSLKDKLNNYYYKFWDWVIKIVTGHFMVWLKRRKHCGALRFRMVRWIYKSLPHYPKAHNEVWDWALNYLPSLSMTFWRGLPVMDVGCTDSLLMYELVKRGYAVLGVDIRDYQAELPDYIKFFKHDILDPNFPNMIGIKFKYILCLSVIELVGCDMYGDIKDTQGDRKALENLHKVLDNRGYLIISLNIENFRSLKGRGYSTQTFTNLIHGLFIIVEITQRCGHICAVLIKSQ